MAAGRKAPVSSSRHPAVPADNPGNMGSMAVVVVRGSPAPDVILKASNSMSKIRVGVDSLSCQINASDFFSNI